MSKASETKAFQKFHAEIKAIGEEEGGTYFDELLEDGVLGTVENNISNDFMAFLGVFQAQDRHEYLMKAEHTTIIRLQEELEGVREQLREAGKYDVRQLKATRASAVSKAEKMTEELHATKDEIHRIEGLLAI